MENPNTTPCKWVISTLRNKNLNGQWDGTWREVNCELPAVVQSPITGRCYCELHKERFVNGGIPFYDLNEGRIG